MAIKRLVQLGSAVMLSLSSILTLSIPLAHAAGPFTCTWTGNGTADGSGHYLFSDAANWSGCNSTSPQPADGDNLVFPDDTSVTHKDAFNDLTGASFSSLAINQGSDNSGYFIDGNAFTLAGNISDSDGGTNSLLSLINAPITLSATVTVNLTNTAALELDGVLTGSFNINQTGDGSLALSADNTPFTGSINVSGGDLAAMSPNAIGTSSAPGATIGNGADFFLLPSLAGLFGGNGCQLFDFNGKLSLTGGSTVSVGDASLVMPKLGSAGSCNLFSGGFDKMSYGAPTENGNVNLNGAITLGSDITFAGVPTTTTITGALSGAHQINMLPGYMGKLVVNSSSNTSNTPNGTYSSDPFSQTLSDSQPNADVNIFGNNTITIDGQRGFVTVQDGGVLKGTGTLGSLDVGDAGIVAPGHSPGCITTGSFSISGSYQAELGGTTACSGYDQIKVTASGSVDLTGGTLDVSFYNGFVPSAGQSFTIVDNGGSDPITGTFSGLAEGATFKVGNTTFAITYKGGDGNDVVLTVRSGAPAKPNTGIKLVSAHPGMTLGLSTSIAATLLYVSRRLKPAAKR